MSNLTIYRFCHHSGGFEHMKGFHENSEPLFYSHFHPELFRLVPCLQDAATSLMLGANSMVDTASVISTSSFGFRRSPIKI